MTIDLSKLNLRKEIVFNLSKERGIENQKAQVVLCMDISGSMSTMYETGVVQDVLERIVPVAMQFDDNQEFELYLFNDKAQKHFNNVTVNNVSGIVKREIINHYNYGGTQYAPPMKMIGEDFAKTKKTGFLKLSSKPEAMDLPVYVIFVTDGENSDHMTAESTIRELSNHGIFFQFVGIGGAQFHFLKKLDNLSGRLIDNANFFEITNVISVSDSELYSKLLAEFPSWISEAKTKNLIK